MERQGPFQNLWCRNLRNKQLQYPYCPISQKVKTNQTMKFGQLIEYDMRNIFLQTHTQNIVKKQFPDPCYTACFDCMAS